MGLVRAVRCSILLWVALAAGCAARAEPAGAAAPPRSEAPEAPGTPVSEGTAKAPAGFVELTVGGVIEAEGDHAVVLIDRARETVVPIGIGGSEALSIHLRHNKRRYPRPLTHDLLDEVLRQLGGRVVKVHIEDMRGNTFIGTVFVVRRGRVMAIAGARQRRADLRQQGRRREGGDPQAGHRAARIRKRAPTHLSLLAGGVSEVTLHSTTSGPRSVHGLAGRLRHSTIISKPCV
jgi:hypothetical protein